MTDFRLNTPVTTSTASVEVTVDDERPLPIGRARFQLVVTDDSGNESQIDEVDVIISDTERPTAILDAPERVNFRESFTLSGERSTDVGGRIVRYRWELVDAPERSRDRQPRPGTRIIDNSPLDDPEIRRPRNE